MGGEIVRIFAYAHCENRFLTLLSRPKSLDDVAAQDHTTKVLQRTLQASNVRITSQLTLNRSSLIPLVTVTSHALLWSPRNR